MDIRRYIERDHAEINALLAQLEAAPSPEKSTLEKLDQLCDLMTAHSAAEEETLYVELEEDDGALFARANEQHEDIDNLLEELLDGEDWETAVHDMATAVRTHFKLEESLIFKAVRFDAARADELGAFYEQKRREELDIIEEDEE
jgi:hemerythrin superfamily protein